MKSSYRPTDSVGRSPPLKRLPSPFGRRAGDEGLPKFVSIEYLFTPSNLSAAERFEGESLTGIPVAKPSPCPLPEGEGNTNPRTARHLGGAVARR